MKLVLLAAKNSDEQESHKSSMNIRQALFLLAKMVFAGGILWWLFGRIDAGKLWGLLAAAKPLYFIALVGIGIIAVLVAAWRWRQLLGIFEITASLGSLFCIVWIGQFFLMFLPGPVGDDAARMVYISRTAPGRAGEACLSVMLDRVIGLGSVLVLCLFVAPWQWDVLRSGVQTFWLAGGVFLAGFCFFIAGGLFLLLARPSLVGDGIFALLPTGRIRTELVRIWNLAAGSKKVVGWVFAAAVVIQVLNCVAFWLAGRAVGVEIPLFVWVSFVPVILAANILPVTIAGLGVREYLLVLFLGVAGKVGEEQALAASLVVFAGMVAVSSMGGLVYVLYRNSGGYSSQALASV